MIDSPRLIAVGGCGRSGTTLMAHLLAASFGADAVPESQFISEFALHRRSGRVGRSPSFRQWKISPSRGTPDSPREMYLSAITEYLGRPPKIIIDHTPGNLGRMRILIGMFPRAAHFIHVVRDPRGVAASVLRTDWGPTDVEAAADLWLAELAIGFSAERAYPELVRRVRYEDLVNTTSDEITNLGSWLSMRPVGGHGYAVPDSAGAQHRLIGQPVDRRRAEAWRAELTHSAISHIEWRCETAMMGLGYSLSTEPQPLPGWRRAVLAWRRPVKRTIVQPMMSRRRIRTSGSRSA